ncbi:hypothetical protein JST99_03740 [Candidatus Dependentiae bacterium]|nr:hypothetical protein [Candidatus Dependentiae bacterium]MCC7414484.1 hypothetical protein [Campylobacterota bacterium]
MNRNLLAIAGYLNLLVVTAQCTTIINGGDSPATVTVYYKGVCKPKSSLLQPDQSLYVNETCERDRIEAVGQNGFMKVLSRGGYNMNGEMITFQFNQEQL